MSGYQLQDRIVLLSAPTAPLLAALALVPFRTDLSATNAALIMVVVVVAVAALGTRAAGALAARSAARLVRFLPHQALPAAHHHRRR